MFLFIPISISILLISQHSNTSHVLIYHGVRGQTIEEPINSNTSHVLIYQNQTDFARSMKKHSNTSHVLIYRKPSKTDGRPSGNIQIHLMFLFINLSLFDIQIIFKFKYISCSYLSRKNVI